MRPKTCSSLVSLSSRNFHFRNTRNDLSRLSPHFNPLWILWLGYRTTPKFHASARRSLSRLTYINTSLRLPRIKAMMIMLMPQSASHCIHLPTYNSSRCSRPQPLPPLLPIILQIASTHRNKPYVSKFFFFDFWPFCASPSYSACCFPEETDISFYEPFCFVFCFLFINATNFPCPIPTIAISPLLSPNKLFFLSSIILRCPSLRLLLAYMNTIDTFLTLKLGS